MGKIQIRSLSKRFEGQNIFQDFDLDVEKGEVLGIKGKSGIGKTTLLRCIADLESYEGDIKHEGDLSYLFQEPRLLPWLNVRKNILIPFKLKNQEITEKSLERMEYLAKSLEVDMHLDKKVGELSGGQIQRVLQVRALVTEPDIVLLDEPFNSLDKDTRKKAYEEVLKICREENITSVLSSHNEDIGSLMDRVLDFHNKEGVVLSPKRN